MAFSVSDVASPCCRGPDLPFPADRCVHEIIETQVDRAPQARAVVEGNRQLTYRELSRRADALAVHLRTLGVGPESLVGLYLERSLEAIVGILGVLKAGGGYVPLDPAYPQERIDFMVHDADPQVILTAGRLRHRLDAYDKPVVCLDGDEYSMDGNGAHPLGQRGNPGNGAYVIYTSGSTGKPKGVMVSHRNLVHSTWARMQYYQESVVAFLLLSSLSFDSSVAGIFWTLAQGGVLVVAPTSLQHDPPGIVRALEEHGISHTLCVPALYGLVLESLQSQELPALRSVIVAGEACPPGIVERHRELLPKVGLFNEYGPTEATVWSTVFDCHDVLQARSIPIGGPIPRAAIYLLDGEGRSVSAGSPGELCIGGPGVTRGYLRRPDLTDERFIPDRHGGGETRRIYRTGDLARLLPDGNIEFLGRLDDQVKIRGFRVELGEIESAVRMHTGVREVAVIAREDPRGAKQVVAYVVPASTGDGLTEELRSLVRAALPEHMVPAAFVLLDTLPRLPNGKMDRGALPAPELDRSNRAGEYAAPRTPVEQALAQIWSQVLGIADVGIHDDFFALGGDSLLSMQIVARASQVGMRVTAEQIADRPTIAGLAEVVGPTNVPNHAEQGVVIGPVPLVPVQRHVLEQMMRTGRRRLAWASLDVLEPLDPAILERAAEAVITHHDALRMRFSYDSAGARGFNAAREDHQIFSHYDLSAVTDDEREGEIRRVGAELEHRLSVVEGPLVQLAYVEFGDRVPGRLLQVIDHLVVDAYSEPIVLQDLETAYRQLAAGEPLHLPAKTTSFKYWAERLAAYERSRDLADEREYWQSIVHEPVRSLPADYAVDSAPKGLRREVVARLSPEETRAVLHAVPRATGAQIDHILLTAIVEAVSDWTGQPVVRIDLRNHGRQPLFDDVDVSRTVGWFTSSFPVLLDKPPGAQMEGTLRTVRNRLREVPSHGMGYQMLAGAIEGERAAGAGRAQIILNYQGQVDRLYGDLKFLAPRRRTTKPEESRLTRPDSTVQITAQVQNGALSLRFVYHERVYRSETIEALGDGICAALGVLAAIRGQG